ncbi:TetR family transcriptional regulator C-terminal domain-containing protein [Paracoccus sp. R12_1]|uniref:TetR family transcriptional regulator C-terminal domain-containing protein n=1 Tax=unclassified Paracoccus (in: a-proteobacteria) TaxID=2688777 RepID=UPI000C0A991F|nr:MULTISPECIES: TetR family transcriptional regulator C-terminal domain-containing protein [unclassified Paracoccus (in: a-proteobacteria)]MBO9454112.1 TetR family transcriptional regulator C-terminal domain-containing protein [Paracoccus sp. R12_2]MBO9484897.1 TetR family transcriptional regulator C-terminal domain-containing protein [Paracoccus sp. R12_1]PHQ68587.1 MAG: TetR family transcriptional regulator [Paracoccus sp. (in: a-proteobacteria)]
MTDQNEPQLTRIQQINRERILEGALTAFSANGFRGATIDQIAEAAGLSKPNVLYYFGSKDEIHKTLLTALLDMWLAPMLNLNPDGDPLDEVLRYVRTKLHMSRDFPRESRLFAYEILQGAPHLSEILGGRLRLLVDDAVAILAGWIGSGRLASVDPHHLIFSIWALTQHYADFEVQVRAVLGPGHDPFAEAEIYLENMFRRMLEV